MEAVETADPSTPLRSGRDDTSCRANFRLGTLGGKGPSGLGESSASGSFPFDKLRVRMTARTDELLKRVYRETVCERRDEL